jgi:cytoskeletal protein CcmA (bactofilin family)
MFSKPSKPMTRTTAPVKAPVAPPPLDSQAARKAPSVASVIAKDMTVEGGLSGEGELHVDGVVRGDVKVTRLTIGESGHIEGTVSAEMVEARGKVIGSITARQIRLFASAHIEGDITHEQLAMETGASFQGRSLKFQRPPPAVAPQPAGDVINLAAVAPSIAPQVG